MNEKVTTGSPILEIVEGEYIVRGIHHDNVVSLRAPSMTGVLVSQRMFKVVQNWFTKSNLTIDFFSKL